MCVYVWVRECECVYVRCVGGERLKGTNCSCSAHQQFRSSSSWCSSTGTSSSPSLWKQRNKNRKDPRHMDIQNCLPLASTVCVFFFFAQHGPVRKQPQTKTKKQPPSSSSDRYLLLSRFLSLAFRLPCAALNCCSFSPLLLQA